MGPKKAKELAELTNKEDVVQAVVMADSFDKHLAPLTENTPRCLLPLANRPILAYALDCLRTSGVQEAFVFCSSHQDQIRAFVKDYNDEGSSLSVSTIVSENCRSFGDAMRDIDSKGVLRKDFILIQGDTVCNADLSPYLKSHKQLAKEDDRNATLTLVLKKASPGHQLRTADEEIFIAAKKETKQILNFQRGEEGGKKIKIPLEVLEDCDNLSLAFDLMEAGIAVCSASVPPLFADNFDFQTLDDFIVGVIDDELLENTLYFAEIDDAYAARASNFSRFSNLNSDVVKRWAYPFCPDVCKGQAGAELYSYHRHNVYKTKSLKMARGSTVEKNSLLGTEVAVGQASKIKESVIGAKCVVGKESSLNGVVLLENVEIGDYCELNQCLIGKNVKIGSNVKVGAKSVLGDGVVIPDGAVIPERSLICSAKPSDGFSDDEDDVTGSTAFGPKAFKFVPEELEDEDDDEVEKISRDLWGLTLDLDDMREEEDDDASTITESSGFSGMEEAAAAADIMLDDDAKFNVFNNEVFESLQRGFVEGINPDNLILEINSSRHAYAVSASQVVHSVVAAALGIPAHTNSSLTGTALFAQTKTALKKLNSVLTKYIKDENSQVEALYSFEAFCGNEKETYDPLAMKILHTMYEEDLVEEDAVLKWFRDEESRFPETRKDFRMKVKKFVEWLNESSDEEDSD